MTLPISWDEFEASIHDPDLRRRAVMYKASAVTNPQTEQLAEDWRRAVDAYKPVVAEVETYLCSHCRRSSGRGNYVGIAYFSTLKAAGRKCPHLTVQDVINYKEGKVE